MTAGGATDDEVCRAARIVPALRLCNVVVMDNLTAHKVPTFDPAITNTGIGLTYLAPYSLDWYQSNHAADDQNTVALCIGTSSADSGLGTSKRRHDR
jgi:hypothetical protein